MAENYFSKNYFGDFFQADGEIHTLDRTTLKTASGWAKRNRKPLRGAAPWIDVESRRKFFTEAQTRPFTPSATALLHREFEAIFQGNSGDPDAWICAAHKDGKENRWTEYARAGYHSSHYLYLSCYLYHQNKKNQRKAPGCKTSTSKMSA